jgi:hypothetical protein
MPAVNRKRDRRACTPRHAFAEPSEETFKKKISKPEYQPVPVRETNMRSFLLMAAAVLSFSATMTFETTEANAVVCARGVVRAGCAGARGAVVVRKPAVVCRTVVVNGVKVRRCT